MRYVPKALAYCISASFIRVVGSEFVQKYLGEGPRMVRDVFRLAKENAPAIIFIDEIDAIATKRFDAQTGGRWQIVSLRSGPQGYKTFFMLNSTEHNISTAHLNLNAVE